MIKAGIYRHYKGGLYRVYELARHSESGEQLVIYRALYGERGLWARPLSMFAEQVRVDGTMRQRFQWQADADGDLHE